MTQPIPKIGVEEEYQLVDPHSGELVPHCKDVMQSLRGEGTADIQHELHLSQIEMASDVCETIDDVRETVHQVRASLARAAEETGASLIAAGTNPLSTSTSDDVTPKRRYRKMTDQYQSIAKELMIFGCHVHISIQNERHGLQVMNRCRRWVPFLQAITANSPFWEGEDTGYASYRRELWVQWPMAGAPPHFADADDYRDCISDLTHSGAIEDESFLYWDIRLPTKVPTIEFRCADVMTHAEDTVAFAGLIRGLVMAMSEDSVEKASFRDGQTRPPRDSVLRYAIWHAARFGMEKDLIDPTECRPVKAGDMAQQLADLIEPALRETGDWECVRSFLDRVVDDGCGASEQRRQAENGLDGLCHWLIKATAETESVG